MKTLSLLALVMLVVGCGDVIGGNTESICVTDSTGIEKCFDSGDCQYDVNGLYFCSGKELCVSPPRFKEVCFKSDLCRIDLTHGNNVSCNFQYDNECFNQTCGQDADNQKCKLCNPDDPANYNPDLVCDVNNGTSTCKNWCQIHNDFQKAVFDTACTGLETYCGLCQCWIESNGVMGFNLITKQCMQLDTEEGCVNQLRNAYVKELYDAEHFQKAEKIQEIKNICTNNPL